ncbi:hypothetical protein LIER_28985 [Lithospermum erythrorhizon]|uniref:Uncharacterized protein n=1 Tax=Lithospermum erythrorhizon TaxID=34254 RepID=A0AAV3RML0_LITER
MMEQKKEPNEVVVMISGEDNKGLKNENLDRSKEPQRISVDSPVGAQRAVHASFPSPDSGRYSPSRNKPPKIPTRTLTRRKSISVSAYAKPKSRFGEPSVHIDSNMFEEDVSVIQEQEEQAYRNPSNSASPNLKVGAGDGNATPKETIRTVSMTPRTPLMASPDFAGGVDEEEEIYKKAFSIVGFGGLGMVFNDYGDLQWHVIYKVVHPFYCVIDRAKFFVEEESVILCPRFEEECPALSLVGLSSSYLGLVVQNRS